MSDIKISLDSSASEGAISVVRVDGVIDTMTAPELEKVMNSLLEQRKYNIIVDLGGVDYISSAGWGIFISNIREIRQNAGDIKLARMIPNVYEIFELLEFDSILRAFDTLEKAKNDYDAAGGKIPVSTAVAAGQISGQASPESKPADPAVPLTPIDDGSPKEFSGSKPQMAPSSPGIHAVVLELVNKDPFFSISEIKNEVNRRQPQHKAGWWKIWSILKEHKLLSKKSRYRRARTQSGDK